MEHIESLFRYAGAAANCAFLVLFAWAATVLYGLGSSSLEAAGGFEFVRGLVSSVTDPSAAAAYALAPGMARRLFDLAAAWFLFVGAAGCSWMALLGVRWLANAVRRVAAVAR